MTETITIEELAEHTGESVARVLRWHELGLLPGDPDAFERSKERFAIRT